MLTAACCTVALVSPAASAAAADSDVTVGMATEPYGSVDTYWTEARMEQATALVDASPSTAEPTTTPSGPDVSESADGYAGPADTLSTASAEALTYFRLRARAQQQLAWQGR